MLGKKGLIILSSIFGCLTLASLCTAFVYGVFRINTVTIIKDGKTLDRLEIDIPIMPGETDSYDVQLIAGDTNSYYVTAVFEGVSNELTSLINCTISNDNGYVSESLTQFLNDKETVVCYTFFNGVEGTFFNISYSFDISIGKDIIKNTDFSISFKISR